MSLVARVALKMFDPYLGKMQRMRQSQHEALHVDADVVFLGDSLTEFGHWNEWFPHLVTANRGIAGDMSGGLLARLDSCLGRQQQIFILIGTNDLTRDVPIKDIAANVEAIVERCRAVDTSAEIFIQSVTPRAASYSVAVQALNDEYRRMCNKLGVLYVDLWSSLVDGRGGIRPEFSLDQLHLTGAGYREWVTELQQKLIRPEKSYSRTLRGITN